MSEQAGSHILLRLRKKWMYKALLSQFLLAAGLTILVFTPLYKLFSLPLLAAFPALLLLFFVIAVINGSWKLNEYDVSRFLNITTPSLEESAELVLKPRSSLNLLEKLQVRKVEKELLSLQAKDPFKKTFTRSLLILLVASIISVSFLMIPFGLKNQDVTGKIKRSINVTIPETILPEIKSANIIITPPAYTGKGPRQQDKFNILAEEGSTVTWRLKTNVASKEVKLIFNDGNTLLLSNDASQMQWNIQKQIRTPGFYQVLIDNHLSELYKIEAIKDQAPAIVIQTPKPNTYITYGQPEKVLVTVRLADDYAISSAHISATVSSGQGEGVKFKEQKLLLQNFTAGRKETNPQRLIDCKALGMQPGDELYFFISATDNHKQETRSEVYIVTLQDTANLTGMNGMISPLDIKPELFRSQRQIIIETEQLLRDKPKISAEEFTKKSNNLGIDQKLLRMRYGKFLGEETDIEIGGDHEHDEFSEAHADQIVEKYTHKHDNAEDASFFDAATKKQLKATLSEMWNAEIKLRTILPKEALPYEYKALQLLKDLQQKSRAYVPKTGIKTTPLKPEKRLTGDLAKINQPQTLQNIQKREASAIVLRRALGILEQLKVNGKADASYNGILHQAFYQLSMRAASQPSVYLTFLSAFKKIINGNFTIKDIENAEQGLQKLSGDAEILPYPGNNFSMDLSRRYFINLNKGNRK